MGWASRANPRTKWTDEQWDEWRGAQAPRPSEKAQSGLRRAFAAFLGMLLGLFGRSR